jgi:hypothetical protein
MTVMKSIYLIQPYQLGGKYKSLALIIPADIVRECNINKSTGFSLRVDKETKKLVLSTIVIADNVLENGSSKTADSNKQNQSGE